MVLYCVRKTVRNTNGKQDKLKENAYCADIRDLKPFAIETQPKKQKDKTISIKENEIKIIIILTILMKMKTRVFVNDQVCNILLAVVTHEDFRLDTIKLD